VNARIPNSRHADSVSRFIVGPGLAPEEERGSRREEEEAEDEELNNLPALAYRLGTSPVLRMLLMSSRKDSILICVSLNRNTVL
jgi:hypothetical protein